MNSKDPLVSRRELLAGSGAAFLCGCASLPRPAGTAGDGAVGPADRAMRPCDHVHCRYFVKTTAEESPGRCGLRLPEVFR